MFYLCWSEDSNSRSHPIAPSRETIIGRSSECDVVINNRNVSRRHAKIVSDGSGYRLIDLNSTYGTFVQRARVAEHALKSGDRIELGSEAISLVFTSEPDQGGVLPSGSTIENHLLDLKIAGSKESSDLEKISWILDFQQRWEDAFTPETAFDQILHSALRLSGAERAFILIQRNGMKYTTGMNSALRRLPESEFHTSRSVVVHVERTGTPIFMVEGLEAAFAAQESVIATGIKAIACLPLKGIVENAQSTALLGILYLDSKKPMHAMSGLDERILRKLAGDAGNVLERIEFVKSIEERRTFERELALAEEMQRALLPREIPKVLDLKLAAFSKPTRYVGGDFYDFMVTPRGPLLTVLGDVAGKGVSAALLSSMILGSLHSNIRAGLSIDAAANGLNKLMTDKAPSGKFVTLFLLELDSSGQGAYISAGHTITYVYRAATATIDELSSTGMILGVFDFAHFSAEPVALNPGDVLIAYSDGLTEAENPANEMLGEKAVLDCIRNSGAQGAEGVLRALTVLLEDFTRGHGQTDDITIVVVAR